MLELYQFPCSHYCEKARWALEYKRLAYRPVNLLPGFHLRRVRKLAPASCVPVLVHGAAVVQGSAEIISYLDAKFPSPALTPPEPQAATAALEWEKYLDEHLGVSLRLWFYHHALADRDVALKFLLQGAHWPGTVLFRVAYPKIREKMLYFMNINAESAAEAERRLLAALQRLDEALSGRKFLVADRFSRADLTACALLSPWLLPSEGQVIPKPLMEVRNRLEGHRFHRWVADVYKAYRQPVSTSIAAGDL